MGFFDRGLVGNISSGLFGKVDPGRADVSGAFPGLEDLGGEFSAFLQERLATPAEETKEFTLGSAAIRDALSGSSATARQRLGDISQTGGFLDSGAATRGLIDVERAEGEALGTALTNLLLGLEDRRTQGVLPFLGAGAGEQFNVNQLNIMSSLQAQLGERQQNIELFNEQTRQAGEFFGNFMGGGGMGCWIARAVLGDADPRWLLARRYLLTDAPEGLVRFYITHGPRLGAAARRLPWLRQLLRPLVDFMVRKGAAQE
jgi:hypothetical protein